jgi:hypothetical protein
LDASIAARRSTRALRIAVETDDPGLQYAVGKERELSIAGDFLGIDREIGLARRELNAGRGCSQDAATLDPMLEFLVDVTAYQGFDLRVSVADSDQLVSVLDPELVHPRAPQSSVLRSTR